MGQPNSGPNVHLTSKCPSVPLKCPCGPQIWTFGPNVLFWGTGADWTSGLRKFFRWTQWPLWAKWPCVPWPWYIHPYLGHLGQFLKFGPAWSGWDKRYILSQMSPVGMYVPGPGD